MVEVMISLAIVLLTLVVFGVAVNTVSLMRLSRDQNVAYHIAAKKVEELRHTSFASLPASGALSDSGLSNLASSTIALSMQNYQSSAEIKQATVTVSWVQGGGDRNVSLTTLIYDGGLNQ